MQEKRFHPLYYFKYIKYALILCVIPMLQALIRFDWESFISALRQDIIILSLSLALGVMLWLYSKYGMVKNALYLRKGIFLRRTIVVPLDDVAVLEIERTLSMRILFASKVTFYFSSRSTMRKYTVIIFKSDAERLCENIMPVKSNVSLFEPSGAEKLPFVMLSANIVTSSIFAVMTAKNVRDIIGADAEKFAIDRFNKFEVLFEYFLPAGLAFVAAIIFLLVAVALLYSLFRTAGFKVCRNKGVMISRGGLITKTERRILCSEIITCDIRITPAARLLRRYPVFVCAGSYHGSDTPVFAFKKSERRRLNELLPEFKMSAPKYKPPYKRNIFQFIWQQLTVLAVTVGLWIFITPYIPALENVLFIPLILSGASLLNAIDGFGTEGISRQDNRTLSVVFTRFFTRHEVCVLTHDISMKIWRTPFYSFDGRADIYLSLPYRRRLRIRGVQSKFANSFKFVI